MTQDVLASPKPNYHGHWEIRLDDETKYGQPPPPFPLCNYCGSMRPEEFVEGIKKGWKVGGSDWKYGWPHKFYVDAPNPNPDEERITGGTYQNGRCLEVSRGTYRVMHLKFYAEHLNGWSGLNAETSKLR